MSFIFLLASYLLSVAMAEPFGGYIVRLPKRSGVSIMSSSNSGTTARILQSAGVKAYETATSLSTRTVLVDASKESIDQLKSQGASVYPNIRYGLTAIQKDAPWHLAVTISSI